MLTIFACPKGFDNEHFRIIQRNAIRSWLLLEPRPQVILFGDEVGTAEFCAEFSILHVPEVQRNEFGTPLLNDLFERVEKLATADILCYINADILLPSSIYRALTLVLQKKRRFLLGGRPWNLDIKQELSFDAGWEQTLADRVAREGQLRHWRACDFFVFPRGLWERLPSFAVGRAYFDNALLYRARRMGVALVDATESVQAIHQNHGYPSHLGGSHHLNNPEALRNVTLANGPSRLFTWKSATHIIARDKLRFHMPGYLRILGPDSRITDFLRRWFRPSLGISTSVARSSRPRSRSPRPTPLD